jgi:hypothetical protein
MPALAGKRDQDLRDTAVTWLANAGCTLPEIASITGHSLQSIHSILKHYLAITPELADSAIAKYVAWMREDRLAERSPEGRKDLCSRCGSQLTGVHFLILPPPHHRQSLGGRDERAQGCYESLLPKL